MKLRVFFFLLLSISQCARVGGGGGGVCPFSGIKPQTETEVIGIGDFSPENRGTKCRLSCLIHRVSQRNLPCTWTTAVACGSRRLQTTCTCVSSSAFSSGADHLLLFWAWLFRLCSNTHFKHLIQLSSVGKGLILYDGVGRTQERTTGGIQVCLCVCREGGLSWPSFPNSLTWPTFSGSL